MSLSPEVEVYQLRVYLRQISPMIWRQLLVRSDNTIADLHHTLQTVMEWHDVHLHHFLIRGKRYGIGRIGTWGFMDYADQVQLRHFNWRLNEKFLYEYNYYDDWQLVIRLEACLPFDSSKLYPRCVGGKRAAPPEDCGGAWRFMQLKQHYSFFFIAERLMAIFEDPDLEENRWDYADEVRNLLYWLDINRFNRRKVNKRLREIFGKNNNLEKDKEEVDESKDPVDHRT
jgi:hypothetical protein